MDIVTRSLKYGEKFEVTLKNYTQEKYNVARTNAKQ